jgi:hypothetical protein
VVTNIFKDVRHSTFFLSRMLRNGGTRWRSTLGTALQTGRSRDRFPMVSFEFFMDSSSGRNMALGSTKPLTETSKKLGKAVPLQAWTGPEAPRFQDNRHMKVVRSAVCTGRLYPPGIIPGTHFFCGPGSTVDIATDYGLDGPGIECRWGRDFSHSSRPVHPASFTMGTGSVPEVKRPGRGADHPPPPSAKVGNE